MIARTVGTDAVHVLRMLRDVNYRMVFAKVTHARLRAEASWECAKHEAAAMTAQPSRAVRNCRIAEAIVCRLRQ